VSLGTVRIIFVSKGYKLTAPIIGFFEAFIWVLAISRIIQNLDNWICYFAYAGGFAMGNYVGMLLEEKLAVGYELVRVITKRDANDLVESLRKDGYGTTFINAQGSKGDVGVLYVIVSRKKMPHAIELINEFNPKALYTIESIRYVNKEIFFGNTPKRRMMSFNRK